MVFAVVFVVLTVFEPQAGHGFLLFGDFGVQKGLLSLLSHLFIASIVFAQKT